MNASFKEFYKKISSLVDDNWVGIEYSHQSIEHDSFVFSKGTRDLLIKEGNRDAMETLDRTFQNT